MATPRKAKACINCGTDITGSGRTVKRCDRCIAADPNRNSHRRAEYMAVGVDCESAKNPAKHHVDLGMWENDMVTFSYGREDGTAGSIKAASGGFLTEAEVFDFIVKNLTGPYTDSDGKEWKQSLFGFHFNHDTGMLLKNIHTEKHPLFPDQEPRNLFLVHKSTAKLRGLLCWTDHSLDGEDCPKYHREDPAAISEILRAGGEGDILAYDPSINYAFAASGGRRFYMEYRPKGDLFHGNKRIDIHDVGMAFPGKFEQVIDKWQPELRDGDREIIAWGKAQRSENFINIDRDKIAAYSEAECVSLARLIRKFVNTIKDATGMTMNLYRLFGSGSVAGEVLKFNGVPDRRKIHHDNTMVCGEEIDNIAQLCYYGGKIEGPVIGLLSETAYPRDINSAYPSQMVHLPCQRAGHGRWESRRGKRKLPARTIGYALVSWSLPEGATAMPPFMVRDTSSSVFSPRMGERVWVTLPEYTKAMEYWSTYIRTHQMLWWIPECSCKEPLAFLSEIYDKRYIEKGRAKEAAAKGNEETFREATSREEVYKLIINSIYGKLAQREPSFGKFTNMHYAAMITGETRAQLNEEFWSGEAMGGTVVYAHTDSVTMVGIERPDEGKKLGAWGKEDPVENKFTIQPGLSISLGGKKHATRGVSKNVIVPFVEKWIETRKDMLTQHPRNWESMDIEDNRMYSLRQAHHINKPWLAGSFHTAPQKIGFRSAKREFDQASPLPGNPMAWKLPPKTIIHPDDVAKLEDLQSYRNMIRQQRLDGAFDNGELNPVIEWEGW